MNLLLVEEKMLDTLIEDWCFPQGSNEASQVSVQWKVLLPFLIFFSGAVRCDCLVPCAEKCRVAVTESLLPLTPLPSCSFFPTTVAANFISSAKCTFHAHFLYLLVQS